MCTRKGSEADAPDTTENMGRKGGGKKAFLKGVAAKPEADEQATLANSDQAQAPPSETPVTREAPPVPASADAAQLPDVASTAQDLESETRGQLTQRHKKVHSLP